MTIWFGPKKLPVRAVTRPKCVLTMVPTQSDQSAAVGTKFSLRGLSGSL